MEESGVMNMDKIDLNYNPSSILMYLHLSEDNRGCLSDTKKAADVFIGCSF